MQPDIKVLKYSYGHIANQPVHFTKWSNTSYAVFNSLGRVIHIGFLSSIIHGLSTVKTLIYHGFLMLFEFINDDELDVDILLQLDHIDLLNIDELIVCEYRNHSTPFSSRVSENITYKYYIKIEAFFGPFFICQIRLFQERFGIFFTTKSIK